MDKHEKKVTINYLKSQKGKSKLTMITAYDALFANIFDGFVDMILIGDSVEMNFNGRDDTLKATMQNMIYHTKAVCRGAKTSYIIADMPFGSIKDEKSSLKNAILFYKKTKADAVKIEANTIPLSTIKTIVNNGIAVVAHIGLTPQNSRDEGGYHVKAKEENEAKMLIQKAIDLENAGASILVVEGTIASVAEKITQSVKIPVIGIGAGNKTDGQVLVFSDAFGFYDKFKPKFVKRFLNGKEIVQNALFEYINEVKSGKFPDQEHSYNG